MLGFARAAKAIKVTDMRWVLMIGALTLLGGCAAGPQVSPEEEIAGEGRETGVTSDILVRPRARPEGLRGVAREAEPAGSEAGAVSGLLGTTVASLGSVSEPGLWLKTPLVAGEQTGQVRVPGGSAVEVRLIPIEGPETAGSRISLGAMQALGLSLGDLPTLEVLGLS